MSRIKVWLDVEERWNIFEVYKCMNTCDCKVSEKLADRFNRLIEILEAMQCYLNIKKIKREEKEKK